MALCRSVAQTPPLRINEGLNTRLALTRVPRAPIGCSSALVGLHDHGGWDDEVVDRVRERASAAACRSLGERCAAKHSSTRSRLPRWMPSATNMGHTARHALWALLQRRVDHVGCVRVMLVQPRDWERNDDLRAGGRDLCSGSKIVADHCAQVGAVLFVPGRGAGELRPTGGRSP